MKIITRQIYERGDFVEITKGYNKGMVGRVLNGNGERDNELEVLLANADEDQNEDNDYTDGGYYNENQVKYITKKEYDDALINLKILRVPGLPVGIQFKRNNFIIGDNVITPANAKKIAEFIIENSKGKKK